MTGKRCLTNSKLNPKIEPRPSPIEGTGIFARQAITAGETIIESGGRVMTGAEFHAFAARTPKYSAMAIDEDTHLLLDDDDIASFGNHSCDANTWMRDEVTTEARRDIAAGEEITIDYALLTGVEDWSMPCHCGSHLCRGTVRGSDWRLPDVQARYRGHFSPFLNRRVQDSP